MPLTFTNGTAGTAVSENQFVRRGQGYGWVSGLAASPGGSGSAVVIDVDSGDVKIGGSVVSASAQSVTLDPGDSTYPRKDILYVANDGTIQVLKGTAKQPSTDANGNTLARQYAPVPEPPDTDGLSGTVVQEVWVPANAADSTDIAQADIIDRRLQAIDTTAPETRLQQSPNFSSGFTGLQAGDYVDFPIPVPSGSTINIYGWGVQYNQSDTPPSNVSLNLLNAGDTVVDSISTAWSTGSPIVSQTAGGSGVRVFKFRLQNDSSNDYTEPDGLGGVAGYEIV